MVELGGFEIYFFLNYVTVRSGVVTAFEGRPSGDQRRRDHPRPWEYPKTCDSPDYLSVEKFPIPKNPTPNQHFKIPLPYFR